MASNTALDFLGFGSLISLLKAEGTICHDRPNLSFNQPHLPFSPPCESFSQNSSTSCWLSQLTRNDIASVNLNFGPALRPINCWPWSSNVTVITWPPARFTFRTLEFLKIET